MPPVTIDVAVELPPVLAARAVALNQAFAQRLSARSSRTAFTFEDGCVPHVSLFMLAVEEDEVGSVLAALAPVAELCPPVPAEGTAYRHNPFGAPELYFTRTPAWHRLQEAVIAAVEPLRRGRLRATDPAGAVLTELVTELTRDEPDGARLRQLRRYGFDEVTDADDDRFNPHVTLAWPVEGQVDGAPDGHRVGWDGLSAADEFSATLTELGVFRMGGYGTCVHRYGNHRLRGA
ncbi:MAG: hypothetical protein WCA46_27865 [Actinocatenispora sp.]